MQMEELSNHSINDPTLLKRQENANECMTSTWQGPTRNVGTIHRSQQIRQRKGHPFEGNEEYDYVVDPKTGWRFYKRVAGKPADKFVRITGQPANSFVIVVNAGPNPLEDEQLEFSAFFKP